MFTFCICNLYNSVLVKSTNLFLQSCMRVTQLVHACITHNSSLLSLLFCLVFSFHLRQIFLFAKVQGVQQILGCDDISFWNARIPMKFTLAQLATYLPHGQTTVTLCLREVRQNNKLNINIQINKRLLSVQHWGTHPIYITLWNW